MKKEININGVEYIRKDCIQKEFAIGQYPVYMVRTYSAGVFYGELKKRNGKEVILLNARRVWSWEGAASLSQLAESGTSKPENCKFPEPVSEVVLTEVIEMIKITKKALQSLNSVKIWKE